MINQNYKCLVIDFIQMNQTRQNLNQKGEPTRKKDDQQLELYESCLQQCDCAAFPGQFKSCFKAWVLFIIAIGVYISIWAINKYTINRQASYYYLNNFSVSPYTTLSYYSSYATSPAFSSSKDAYTGSQLNDPAAVALSLVYSWIMWKLPLIVFSFKIIDNKVNYWIKYTTFGSFFILLLIVDILITAFQLQNYPQWIFYCVYVFLTLILICLNSIKQDNLGLMMNNALWPLSYIALFYALYSILIPALYNVFYNNLAKQTAVFVQVYIFPLVDLLGYYLLIIVTLMCTKRAYKFIEVIYFLNSGYALGNILLTGYTEVEFYYLVGYFILRNIVTNWILQNLQKQVKNPIVLPGWGLLYFLSYGLNYIPIIGIGKLVISKSFFSQMLIFAFPILNYQIQSDYYISTTPYPTSASDQINTSYSGNMYWGAALIIWSCLIFTQKYHYHEVQIKSFFFYLFGIYLFYFGLSCGLQLDFLRLNSL